MTKPNKSKGIVRQLTTANAQPLQTRQHVVIASTGKVPSAEVIAEIMKHINRPLAARTLVTMCAEHAVTTALRIQDTTNLTHDNIATLPISA